MAMSTWSMYIFWCVEIEYNKLKWLYKFILCRFYYLQHFTWQEHYWENVWYTRAGEYRQRKKEKKEDHNRTISVQKESTHASEREKGREGVRRRVYDCERKDTHLIASSLGSNVDLRYLFSRTWFNGSLASPSVSVTWWIRYMHELHIVDKQNEPA